MNTLKAEKRDLAIKAKKLRRQGLVTGSIFGKDMDGAVAIQMDKKDVDRLLRTDNKGSQVSIEIGSEKRLCLIKEIQFDTLKGTVTELDFQALNANEKVRSQAEIILVDPDVRNEGIVEQHIEAVEFRAYPKDLVDRIKIDMKPYKIGDVIKVSDLEIAKNPDIHLITPADEIVVSVSEIRNTVEEPAADATTSDAAAPAADAAAPAAKA